MPCRRTQYRLQLFHKDFKSAFELGKVLQPISISIPGVREFTDRVVDIEEHIAELLNCSEQDNEPQHRVFPSFNHHIVIGNMNPAICSADLWVFRLWTEIKKVCKSEAGFGDAFEIGDVNKI